jgi:hypothetical protein
MQTNSTQRTPAGRSNNCHDIRNDLALSNVTIVSYHILSAELASCFGSAIHEQREYNGIKSIMDGYSVITQNH